MEYILKIKEDEFSKINYNKKSLLIRIDGNRINKIEEGDIISFEKYEKCSFNVCRVAKYKSLDEIFENEKIELVDSGETNSNIKKRLRKIYPKEKESRGLCVIELIKQIKSNEVAEIVSLSELVRDNSKIVDQIIEKAYEVKDFLGNENYIEKTISSILNDNREILVCNINKKAAGFVFLKKDNEEKKICYVHVFNKFCNEKIVTKLIEKSFNFLETERPYIVLNNHNFGMFSGIIEKYEWQQTKIRPCGNKDNSTIEMIFNGENN